MTLLISRPMIHRLAALRRASPREVLVLAQLVLAAGLLEAALRGVRFPRLAAWVRGHAHPARAFPLGGRTLRPDRRLALCRRAARVWRGPDGCLPRALLVLWLTLGDGRDSCLVLGVRRVPGEPFRAHAWVESDGQILGERADAVCGYTVLARY